MTDHVAVQPNSISAKSSTHHVVHLIRPSLPATTLVNNAVFQSVKTLTPPVPVTKKVNDVDQITAVPAKSSNRVQPLIISSKSTMPPNIKTQQTVPNQTNLENSKLYGSKITESQTIQGSTNIVIKTEGASDGKKIKILSDVSLNDAKAKLLEIDKLSSKNMKFTNVIKGTDTSSSKSTLHISDSACNPVLPNTSRSVPLKAEIDKMSNSKFTNVITGTNDSRACSTSNSTSRPVMSVGTSSKPLKSEIKLIPSRNLKLTNVIEGTDKSASKSTVHVFNPTHKPVRSLSTASSSVKSEDGTILYKNLKFTNISDGMDKSTSKSTFPVSNCTKKPVSSSNPTSSSVKTENETFSYKNLKFTNVNDGMDKNKFTAQPVRSFCTSSISVKIEDEGGSPKILNFSNVTDGITSKSTVYSSDSINQPARSSCMTSKPYKAGIDNISSKNLNFTHVNATKSAVHFAYSTSKPVMPLYSPSVPIKTEIEEIRHNDLNLPNVKRTKDIPLQTVGKTSIFKVKPVIPMGSTSIEVTTKQSANTDENVEIIMPSKQKYLSKRNRSDGTHEATSINDATKSLQDALWATSNPRTYARHNIKRLLNDKIIKKARLQEGSFQNLLCKVDDEQTFEITIPIEADNIESKCDVTPVQCDLKSEKIVSVDLLELKPSCNKPTHTVSAFSQADESAQSTDIHTHSAHSVSALMAANESAQSTDVHTHSETVVKKNFYGFSIEEANESASVLKQIKALLSRKPLKEAPLAIDTDSKLGHEKDVRTVGNDNELWVLNHETGVLEEQINKDVTMVLKQDNVSPARDADLKTDRSLYQSNAVTESTPKKQISINRQVADDTFKVRLQSPINSPICDTSPIPSKIPVIEDADDEISDIDLVHRSKAKCTGSATTPAVKNRRAILKSIELHRKAFMPATTDDESELSLCVRPPRPKLRKSRSKQTVEQLKIQQNAHVSLLKRFTQTDLDNDNLNEEDLLHFLDGMMDRIEVLENQVKSCFDRQNHNELNVETIGVSEECVSVQVDPVTEKNESVKPSERVTEINEFVKPSENLSSVNTSLNCVVTCEPQLNLPDNADTADDGEGKRTKSYEILFTGY